MNVVDPWENAELTRAIAEAPVVIPALTGVRFVAALMVMLGHGSTVLQFDDFAYPTRVLAPLAPIGMTVFFVLSGFIMWINYAPSFRRDDLGAALRKFGVARFARLYPMYACVLVPASLSLVPPLRHGILSLPLFRKPSLMLDSSKRGLPRTDRKC
jgi:peptidoglycan/LPS O-acetylase OafA/YrhL